jgi:hypothetical protein
MKKHAIVLMAALVASPAAVWAARLEFDPSAHFVMNGKRAFLLGVYDTGLGYTTDEASWEQTLFAPGGDVHNTRALSGIPLNMYLNYQFGAATISSMQALMNVLQRHGMMYFQTGNCFSHFSWTGGGFGIGDPAYVQQFATNPGAAGYYIMDECDDSLLSETTQHHQQLHGWDPAGKTLAVLIADNRDPSPWINSADILGTDPYPLFGAEATTGYPHFLVADMTSRLRMVTPASKPIVSVLQLFKFTDNSRLPTFAEMRTHAIMSIVEGAQGIFWWELGVNGLRNQPNALVSQWMGYLTTLVKELDALQPVLLADPAPTALTGNSTLAGDARAARVAQLRHNGDMIVNQNFFEGQWYYGLADQLAAGNTNGIFMLDKVAPIHTLAKIHNGNGYVFAYNYTNQTTPVTFTWSQSPIRVTEFSSGQEFARNGNQWSDTFGPYESRIYFVDMGGTIITPPPPQMTAAITSPPAGSTVSGTVNVEMSVSGGAAGSNTFKLSIDGALVSSQTVAGTTASYVWDTTGAGAGSHTLSLTVTDSKGQNANAPNVGVTVAGGAGAGPTIAITDPTPGDTVSGTNWVIVWPGGAQGPFLCTVVVDEITSVAQQGCVDSPTSIPWDTTIFSNGAHTIRVIIGDAAHSTASAAVNVVVDNASPLTVAITGPKSGETVSGTNWVIVWPGGAQGVPTCTVKVDGTQVAQQACADSPTSIPWNTTVFSNGAHTITVTITDAAGRTASASVNVVVSNGPLTVAITAPSSGTTVSGTNWVIVWPGGAQGTPTCTVKVDGIQLAQQACADSPTSIPWNTAAVSNGAHTISVVITDATSRTGTASVGVTVAN